VAEPQSVTIDVTIDASIETVYRCLTETSLLAEWLDADVDLEARVGGTVRIAFHAGSTIVEGEVVELLVNRRLAFTWGVRSGPDREALPVGSTRVTFDLQRAGDRTRVVLEHAGLPDEQVDDHRTGWREYADALAALAAAQPSDRALR